MDPWPHLDVPGLPLLRGHPLLGGVPRAAGRPDEQARDRAPDLMTDEIWAESVGTSSRTTRLHPEHLYLGNVGNQEADLGGAAQACLIATIALTWVLMNVEF